MNDRDILKRYPRLVAHLICESLGYFCVMSAAKAIQAHLEKRPSFCEWYCHMAGFRKTGTYEENLIDINRETLERAFRGRHHHKGYMASYPHAVALVKAELEREGVTQQMFASWF